MDFDYEIAIQEDKISIIPFSESETDTVPDNFDISINKFWSYVVKEGLNQFCTDFYDPKERDGHGQLTGVYGFFDYFELHHNAIKKDLRKYLIENNLLNSL